jgi:CubicO group peptidase (beta-lactamase class C family)
VSVLAGMAAASVAGCATARPDSVLRIATGVISHTLCSEVFVSGLDAGTVYATDLKQRPGMRWVDWAVRYHVDTARQQVRATIAGDFESRAVHRTGRGCLVVHGAEPPEAPADETSVADEPAPAPLMPDIAGPAVVEPTDERLRAALDQAFLEPDHPPYRWTTAVVVVHDGQIIAERYAPGYGVDTPLLGYSATKSVTSALVGILVRHGRLAAEQPAPVPAWSDPRDARRAITVDHLLRMTSGLALDETQSPFNPVARMLYLERDMAGFAENAGLEAPPGHTWNYTSGNTLILSRIIRDAVGGHATDVLTFAHRELFDPLGMRGVTLEFDATGTPVGSTYMLAPARDWARFGLLYLNDGVVGGRRVLPVGWVRYASTPTLATGYGAGFWTNRVAGNMPWSQVPWGIPGAPRDTFFARGLLGQYVVVVPSEQLVVARFGVTQTADADIKGVGDLVADVISALHTPSLRQAGPPAHGENALFTRSGSPRHIRTDRASPTRTTSAESADRPDREPRRAARLSRARCSPTSARAA